MPKQGPSGTPYGKDDDSTPDTIAMPSRDLILPLSMAYLDSDRRCKPAAFSTQLHAGMQHNWSRGKGQGNTQPRVLSKHEIYHPHAGQRKVNRYKKPWDEIATKSILYPLEFSTIWPVPTEWNILALAQI